MRLLGVFTKMLTDWFAQNIYSGDVGLAIGRFYLYLYPSRIFGWVMFFLFLWASFHLITDLIMAFRAVFGFGYKKRKGGSH